MLKEENRLKVEMEELVAVKKINVKTVAILPFGGKIVLRAILPQVPKWLKA